MLQFNGVSLNKENMMETEAVFQLLTSWLKVEALLRAWYIAVTLATFQPPMFWLKAVTPNRVWLMFVRAATFHAPIF